MAPRDEEKRERGRGDRIKRNFLVDRRLRFLVHTIALGGVVFALVIFEMPALFGIAFVGWWVVWTLQREAADIYREVYEINDRLAGGDRAGKSRS